MNKKIILPIFLVLLLRLAVFVSAKMVQYSDDLSNKIDYNIEIPIFQGWNLVASSPIWDDKFVRTSDSEIKQNNIKAIYYYFRHENKYLQIYPNSQEVESYLRNAQEKPDEALYFAQSPVWVYSDKSGVLKYQRADFPKWEDNTNILSLTKGWNFVTITPEMGGKSLSQIKGDCNIQKVVTYIPESWRTFFDINGEKNNDKVVVITGESAGYGIVMKVSSDCKLGLSGVTIPSLPNLP